MPFIDDCTKQKPLPAPPSIPQERDVGFFVVVSIASLVLLIAQPIIWRMLFLKFGTYEEREIMPLDGLVAFATCVMCMAVLGVVSFAAMEIASKNDKYNDSLKR